MQHVCPNVTTLVKKARASEFLCEGEAMLQLAICRDRFTQQMSRFNLSEDVADEGTRDLHVRLRPL